MIGGLLAGFGQLLNHDIFICEVYLLLKEVLKEGSKGI